MRPRDRASFLRDDRSDGLMELDPFSHEFHEDPYPTYAWLRDHAPVYRSADGVVRALALHRRARSRAAAAALQLGARARRSS